MFRQLVLLTVLGFCATPAQSAESKTALGPRVIVHKAYRCSGSGALQPDTGMQLVAIDVEFQDFGDGLDLDDVEIIDVANGRVLQSAPEIAFLRSDGTFYAWHERPPDGPLRPLLVFQTPKSTKSVQLKLADEILSKVPVKIQPSGPALPPERNKP